MYKVERATILHDDDVNYLIDNYKSTEKTEVKRFYNLFYCNKYDHLHELDGFVDIKKKFEEYFNRVYYSLYIVEYGPGSFVKKHADNDDAVEFTAITLLEKDCEGGENILYSDHYKDDYDVNPDGLNRYEAKHEVDHMNHKGNGIIPHVVKQDKVGETLIYNRSTKHEVSQIISGKRVVLVAWMRSEKKNEEY